MQDEELDKLLTDAASQHHPPYNIEDWDKMLLLLNKNLPQHKDRRRPLFLILLLLFLTGGVVTAILQPWKKAATATPKNNDATVAGSATTLQQQTAATLTTQKQNAAPEKNTAEKIEADSITPNLNTTTGTNYANTTVINANGSSTVIVAPKKQLYSKKGKTTVKIKPPVPDFETAENITPPVSGSNNIIAEEINENFDAINRKPQLTTTAAVAVKQENSKSNISNTDSTSIKKETDKDSAFNIRTTVKQQEKKKKQHRFVNNFALTFSAGGDVSYINLSNTGKLKTFYGAGLSYVLNKRLRISSGLLVSQKTYTAKPGQYKLPYGTSYPHLQKIDADCKIYEIPLSLYYNFAQKNKHNWFAGSGISSYIMKKEVYDYVNKSPSTGQTYSWRKTVSNKNNHILSVLALSGGYQYTVNKRFAFMAEPYLKIPLSGVGDGKVKLNSAGLLFTLAVKPFKK